MKSRYETIDFYYSIGSRYSYLAASQVNALEQATGCYVEWHPINSVRLISQKCRVGNAHEQSHSEQ